ncbi:MAG: phage tail sheath subtilisin-like domain-containing protein [Schleiferiaceae bacterium]|jgi:phage tail sheath protein FI|nr:phage tail sheath subtilisin-like domain-containing protein [Schleiferiaceae bacterium]
MATTYKTPGVYVEEVSVFPPSVAQVETAIPAFIGYTEKAKNVKDDDLLLVPKRITSLKEYEQYFGKAFAEAVSVNIAETLDSGGSVETRTVEISSSFSVKFFMYYQLQMYFANGGGPCYITSVGKYSEAPNAGKLYNQAVKGLAEVEAKDEPTLIVFTDTPTMSKDNHNLLMGAAIAQSGKLMDRIALVDVIRDDAKTVVEDMAAFRSATQIGTNKLSYGAAYYPPLNTSLTPYFEDSDVTLAVAVGSSTTTLSHDTNKLDSVQTADESLYRIIKNEMDVAIQEHQMTLYPSGAVAGVYATVDANRGVWKAPANVSLSYVNALSVNVTNDDQGVMNVDPGSGKSVNAIRGFTGKGIIVWGARTLAGNDNEWRYVPVRRFFNMVEESVKKATGTFVFEPNDANTWVKVKAMIDNYLTLQWREGALAGAKPEHAFFVKVGLGETMSAQDILEGRMIVEIGMAAVRPAEFIILRFSHMMQQS